MDFGIAGKVALVIGGSRGLGRACSDDLAREGCRVVVASLNQGSVDQAVRELADQGFEATGVAGDCTTKEGIENAVAYAKATFGSPDIAIFNVDSGPKGAFLEIDDDVMERANRNNVMAFTWLVRAVMGHMREQKFGRIVTIGTYTVRQPHRKLPRAAQNTYRVGAVALSKAMADELGPYGITVNTMGTGGFLTDQFRSVFTKLAESEGSTLEAYMAKSSSEIPAGRLGDPAEMGAAVAFLCSTRASYITGQVLTVDGGRCEALQ